MVMSLYSRPKLWGPLRPWSQCNAAGQPRASLYFTCVISGRRKLCIMFGIKKKRQCTQKEEAVHAQYQTGDTWLISGEQGFPVPVAATHRTTRYEGGSLASGRCRRPELLSDRD